MKVPQETWDAAQPHLDRAAECEREIERIRDEVIVALVRERNAEIRRACEVGVHPPAVAKHVGVSITLARSAAAS